MDASKKKNLPGGNNLGTTLLRSGKHKEATPGGDTAADVPKTPQVEKQTPVPRRTTATGDRLKSSGTRLPLPRTAIKSGPDMWAKKYIQAVGSSLPPPRTPAKPNPGAQPIPGCVGSGTRGICRLTPGVLPGKDRNPPVNQTKNHASVIGNYSTDSVPPAAVPDPIKPAVRGVSQSSVGRIATQTPSVSVSGVLDSNMFECAQPAEVQVAEDVFQVATSTYIVSPAVQAVLQNPIPSNVQAGSHVSDLSATSGANPSGVPEESSDSNQPDKEMVDRALLEKAAAEDDVNQLTEKVQMGDIEQKNSTMTRLDRALIRKQQSTKRLDDLYEESERKRSERLKDYQESQKLKAEGRNFHSLKADRETARKEAPDVEHGQAENLQTMRKALDEARMEGERLELSKEEIKKKIETVQFRLEETEHRRRELETERALWTAQGKK